MGVNRPSLACMGNWARLASLVKLICRHKINACVQKISILYVLKIVVRSEYILKVVVRSEYILKVVIYIRLRSVYIHLRLW